MNNSVLEVKNLTKKFGNFTAVDNVSFSVKEGEILGLLGVNGAGKTTTLQMILGVLTATQGSVRYFGKDLLTQREEILEQVNFSSTYTNLPWRLKVKECLTFLSYFYNINDRKRRIDKIASIFQIEHLLNKKISQLSAGQRTTVNLAKSFLNFPKLLLLDEPTASLDPEIALYIRKLLLRERKQFGMSILFTSHNMAEVEEMCDRVVFMDKGEIIADDMPENLSKKIQVGHVTLLVQHNLEKVEEYCHKHQLHFEKQARRITIDIKEKEIPKLLKEIGDFKVEYQEISIEKPTLEDYFLQVAHKNKAKEEDEFT